MTIVKYIDPKHIEVKFDSGYITETSYAHFVEGSVKDLLEPTVCGVGYVGGKKYSRSKDSRAYSSWMHMIWRCYGDNGQDLSYKDCVVCEEWKNFQVYAQWFYDNYYEVPGCLMSVDKDLISQNSRTYSPSTCCILPDCINSMIITQPRKQKQSQYYGVLYYSNKRSPYGVNYYTKEGYKRKKMFRTEHDAYDFFVVEIENRIKAKAQEIKQYLPTKIFEAIMAFSYKKAVAV